MPSSTILRVTGVLAMTSALALAACGGDNSSSGSGAAATTGATTTGVATTAAATTTGGATTSAAASAAATGKTCANATPGGGLERLCKADRLVVGVKFDQPLFGLKNPTTGEVEGFDVEIAKLIANALGK